MARLRDAPVIGVAHPTYDFREWLEALAPDVTCLRLRSREDLRARIGEVDVLAQSSGFWDDGLLADAPRLRLIQSLSVGVNHFGLDALRAHGVRLANAQGCVDIAVAEHAIGLMLTLTRRLHVARDNQRAHVFEAKTATPARREGELFGRTLLIIDLGPIGQRLAGLAKAFGMKVIGVRRDPSLGAGAGDEVFGQAALPDLLPRADIVALACPLTRETQGLIDAAALAAMKPGALLINVARGKVVDEPALIEALRAGRLAGAGLDCFWTEPLPGDSPLWDFENVVITPNSAGETPLYEARLAEILVDNIRRLQRGEAQLRNEIV